MVIAREVVFRVPITPKGKPKARNEIIIHPTCLTELLFRIAQLLIYQSINKLTMQTSKQDKIGSVWVQIH